MQAQKKYTRVPLTEPQKARFQGIAKIYDDNLKLPCFKFNDEGQRVLIIIDKLGIGDNDNGVLFGDKEGTVFEKLLINAFKQKNPDIDIERITLINWECARPEVSERKNSEDKRRINECNITFWSRVKYFIKQYAPDIVVCAGLDPFNFMFRDLIDNDPKRIIRNRLNRIYKAQIDNHKFKLMGTIDLTRPCSYDPKHKEFANLLGYFLDGLRQALNGRNDYTVTLPDTKFVYINSIKRFKSFYKKLLAADIVAIDTEGDGKGRMTSKLYCMQFAFTGDKGYFLPIDHPDTPFSSSELKYIKRKMKYYFEFERAKKYHIYQYGKYDIIQIYAQLGIRYYNHRVYDIQGGQFLWNENLPKMKAYGVKPYALDFITMQFGCTIYEDIEFSKGDRGNIAKEGLTQRLIEYSVYDATVMIHIHNCQIDRAKKAKHKKFLLYNCEQISDTLISLAQMEYTGALVDRKQIFYLKSKDGPINKSINAKLEGFKDSKAAQAVNKYILKKKGLPSTGGMFGKNAWAFNVNEQEAQDLLFYKALKLKPLDHKKDGRGKIDKAFLKQYEKECPEVAQFKDYKAACTLRNNFVNKMYLKIFEDNDTIFDSRLRSSYTYTQTTTNRLSSVNLNLQNLVARGEWAKPLKKAFISPPRCILVKNDYSAQEVRDWCNQAGDELLADAFYQGLKYRQELRILAYNNPESWEAWLKFKKDVAWDDKKKWNEEAEKTGATVFDLKSGIVKKLNNPVTKEIGALSLTIDLAGDVHKLNCARFFGVAVLDVTDDQRYDIKAVVFGTIYGKTAAGLAKSKAEGGLGKTEEECQAIIDKLFVEFKVGGDWLFEQYEQGQKNFYVEAPLGMRRHLDGYYHTRQSIINAMNRRGPNSKIQGNSSQIGTASIRIMQKLFWNFWSKHDIDVYWKSVINDVHDAVESETPISFSPIYLYMMEHASTTLIHRRFEKVFDFKMTVGLEIEFNIGPHMADVGLWGFDHVSLENNIVNTIDYHEKELGYVYKKGEAKQMIKDAKHNWNIIRGLRLEELEIDVKNRTPAKTMLMNEENARSLGLRIEGHSGRTVQY